MQGIKNSATGINMMRPPIAPTAIGWSMSPPSSMFRASGMRPMMMGRVVIRRKGDLGLELTNSEEVTYHISQADHADYDRKRRFDNGSWNCTSEFLAPRYIPANPPIPNRKPSNQSGRTDWPGKAM